MAKRQNPSWLCKLGFHKWRDYGESVVVTWRERTQWIPPHARVRPRTHSREVFTGRKCLRCGIDLKRRLIKNPDGSLSCIGWESAPEFEFEKARARTRRKMVR